MFATLKWDPDQPRDKKGQWAKVGERIAALKAKYPIVAQNYVRSTHTEMGSIESHTKDVGREWETQLTHEELAGISERFGSDVQKLMADAIPLHDIGKAEAIEVGGAKERQHEYTIPILQGVLRQEGHTEKDITLATELLNHDLIGPLFRGYEGFKANEAKVVAALKAKAKKVGMNESDFITLQLAFYQADAAAYPYITQYMQQEPSGKWTFSGNKKIAAIEALVQKFDPHQLRDAKGRWATGGKAGALVTDLGNTYLHGTAQAFLDDILRNGIRGSEGGKIHPKDKRNRTLALPGHVYMTTDLEEAKAYAGSAGLSDEFYGKHKETVLDPVYQKGTPRISRYEPSYESGTEIGGGLPCVITVELPPHVVKKLRKDRRSDILTPDPYSPGGDRPKLSDYARSYKGDIKPEWIKSITYQTRDAATNEGTWHTIDAKDWKTPGPTTPPYLPQPPGWEVSPEWKKHLEYLETSDLKTAAESTVFYIPWVIRPVKKVDKQFVNVLRWDEALHPRDAVGQFSETRGDRSPHEQKRRDFMALVKRHGREDVIMERLRVGVLAKWQAWSEDLSKGRKKPLKADGAAAKKLPSYKEAKALEETFHARFEAVRRKKQALATQAKALLKVPVADRSDVEFEDDKNSPVTGLRNTHAKNILQNFRQFDGSGVFAASKFTAEQVEQIKKLGQAYSDVFLNRLRNNPDGTFSLQTTLRLSAAPTPRAFADGMGIYIGSGREIEHTVNHEVAHHIEMRNQAVLHAAVALREKLATQPREIYKLNTVNHALEDTEIALKGNFPDPYAAKLYPKVKGVNGEIEVSTEMISTGVESYLKDPLTFARDREAHFNLIFDVMQGKYRS